MHPDFLDRWSRLDSPIHRAPAALKLGFALALVLGLAGVPRGAGLWLNASAALLLLLVTLVSRIPVGFLLGRWLLLSPFVLGASLMALAQPQGRTLALQIAMRSSLSLATMLLLANTTPFSELLGVARRMHAPALLVTVLALTYRYLFLLADEAQRLQRARRSRTFVSGRFQTWPALAGLVSQLFVRSTERADRIYAAMCARGWQ